MAALQPSETLHDRSYLDELTERTASAFNQGLLAWHKQEMITDEQLDELMENLDNLYFSTWNDWRDWMDDYLYKIQRMGGAKVA